MRVNVSDIPRQADDATIFLVKHIDNKIDGATNPQGKFKTASQKRETERCVRILLAALEKSSFPPQTKKLVKSYPTKLNADAPYHHLRRLSALIIDEIELANIDDHFSPEADGPNFKLPKDDKKSVLKLASEMREMIMSSDFFDDPHKNRLNRRVSAIENEVIKAKGQFDVMLGGIVDFGEALGTFGEKAKPLFDRMLEIRGIAQKTSEEYEKLPAPEEIKKLPAPDKSK